MIDQQINVIDEFTSVVDRNTAKSLSLNIRKHFDELNLESLYIASCHRDIIEYLQPDYIYDTDIEDFVPKENLRRPEIQLHIETSSYEHWKYFSKYHYLDSKMSKAVHCYTAYINKEPVAFLSVIHGTGRDIKSYWRESRLVVIPEYQGLGIGKTLSDSIALEYVSRGLRYFSKTAHPALGEYRNVSELWRGTSTNGICRSSYLKDGEAREQKGFGKTSESILRDSKRICYSHEFIGKAKIIPNTSELDDWI
jgi:GNAT superfamily N-acetyltransferase